MVKAWRKMRLIVLVAAGAVMACSPMAGEAGGKATASAGASTGASASANGAVHPESGLPVIDLAISTAKGRHAFRVELARTSQQQARGLMFRTEMGADEGMLFIRNPPDVASFWMRNTVIPLDIIYIGTDGRILNIANAIPYDETPLSSAGVAGAVLELNGGRAAELGIKAGDKVTWETLR